MAKSILIKLSGKNSKVLSKHFIDWFKSSGEFKFLDFVDMVDPKSNYDGLKIKISECDK